VPHRQGYSMREYHLQDAKVKIPTLNFNSSQTPVLEYVLLINL